MSNDSNNSDSSKRLGRRGFLTGEEVSAENTAAAAHDGAPGEAPRTAFSVQVPPHSYRVFSTR